MGARVAALALMVVGAPAPARADCRPTAIAHGDPALVQTVTARLAASGIATTTSAGCPSVHVQIDARGERVHIAMTDAYDRASERDVQDVATAAAIVESWTRQEVEAGSLPPIAEVAAVAAVATPIDVAAAFAPSLGSDRTTWLAASLAGCARVGPICLGGALRGETDTNATGTSASIDQSSYAVAALATIDLPLAAGGFVIAPGIGAGYSWMHVVTHHHDGSGHLLDVPSSDHRLDTAAHVAVRHALAGPLSAVADLWADLHALRSDSQFGPTASLSLGLGIAIEVP